jgi:hypothetical protein
MRHIVASLALATLAIAAPLSAQVKPPAKDSAKMEKMDHSKMDHSKMDHGDQSKTKAEHGGDHAKSAWKELDGYHELMMQTWHPIKEKGDVGPIKVKAKDMFAASKKLAGSKAPKGCDSPNMNIAADSLVLETKSVADLVANKADDSTISSAMKKLHDKFEVLETGCSAK